MQMHEAIGKSSTALFAVAFSLMCWGPGLAQDGSAARGECGIGVEGVLLSRTDTAELRPEGGKVVAVLQVRGDSLPGRHAQLCLFVSDTLVYYDEWPVWRWLYAGSVAVEAPEAEVAKRAVASVGVFSTFPSAYDHGYWYATLDTNPYAGVAYSLKELAYRARVGLAIVAGLSQHVRDSILAAPVDSTLVRDIVRRFASVPTTMFAYWIGGETTVQVAWCVEQRRFLIVTS
jgi:hypothetical protein